MTDFISEISQSGGAELTLTAMLTTILCAFISGILIAGTYYISNKNRGANWSFTITLFMLPAIMSIIILFVGSNVARAFSLAGALTLIRFRSTGEPKDIGYIFFAAGAGLASGIGLYLYGLAFVLILCAAMLIAERFAAHENPMRLLKITIPEDLNYHDAFADIFGKYTSRQSLHAIKTADLGSVFVLSYYIRMKKGADEKAMLDALRCRNANLDITYSEIPRED